MMFGTKEPFEYFQCGRCGCLQISDIPKDLGAYYPSEYYSFNPRREPSEPKPAARQLLEKWRTRTALFGCGYKLARIASQVVDLPPQVRAMGPWLKKCGIRSFEARFLDVGCGSWSWWLSDLKALGFRNLLGVDPFVAGDLEDTGVSILKRRIDQVSGRFELITFHHSLEHVADQVATLAAARSLLTTNGSCLVRLPLVSSAVWEQYRTDWVELDAPRHLYLHSLDSIKLVAAQAGLQLVEHFSDSTEFEFWGSEQYRRDLPLMAEESFLRAPGKSNFTFREMSAFKARAKEANREGRGGRGCFFFRAAT